MADNASRGQGVLAAPAAPSHAATGGPLPSPSPGTSRVNSPSEAHVANTQRPSSGQHAHPPRLPSHPASGQQNYRPALLHRHSLPPLAVPAQVVTVAPRHVLGSNNTSQHHGPHKSPYPSLESPGFFSPGENRAQLALSSQYGELSQLISRTEPQVVRRVVRDSYNSCLLGSEYHFGFLMKTALYRAAAPTLRASLAPFGSRVVQSTKHQLMEHFTASDLDELAQQILAKASNDFLDQALAKRLETIRARSLVNALAKAERLGYDVNDTVEERRDGTEHVKPYLHDDLAQHESLPERPVVQPHVPPPRANSTMSEARVSVPLATGSPAATLGETSLCGINGLVACARCNRPVSGLDALRYHQLKKACNNFRTFERVGKDLCVHCGTEFNSAGGLPYHVKSQVCGTYSDSHVNAIMPTLAEFYRKLASAPVSSVRNKNSADSTQTSHGNSGVIKSKSSPPLPSTPTDKTQDPYAHLSSERKKELKSALAMAEAHYGGLMRQAQGLNQPQKAEEMAKLKNSLNTKLSTTRKKFGVRLRERRTKSEVDADHKRITADEAVGVEGEPARLQRPSTSEPAAVPEPAAKKKRLNENGESAPNPPADMSPTTDLPRKRIPQAEIGGLGVSPGTAEHTDPTSAQGPSSQFMNGKMPDIAKTSMVLQTGAALNDPLQLSDTSDTTDSDSEEEDDDIPAVAPRK